MKFTNGYWLKRDGWNVYHPRELQRVEALDNGFRAYAPTRHIDFKGAELDLVLLTVTVQAVKDGIVKVTLEHFRGEKDNPPHFNLDTDSEFPMELHVEDYTAHVSAGDLRADIEGEKDYRLSFSWKGKEITSSILRSAGIAVSPDGEVFMHEQLTIQPMETIYGLGERFGNFVKNGQVVDMWNADGGTASEQAYKNIPFYMSSEGYGIFVNHPEEVSFEIASEVNSRVQFSVPHNKLEYFVIGGPTPKDVLRRYTGLTGRPPVVPQWSYGLWLSTSFKTDYSLDTINHHLDLMEENGIPVSVLHFDCYWMRPSHWCDFVWDPEVFDNPEKILQAIHDRGIKVCVWINPYIAQQSHLFDEGMKNGYLLKKADGSVRQWNHWQSGMGWVDFTNPQAKAWWQDQLRKLLRQGVDAFKTDFGERIPTDVQWYSGADPFKMHNYYSYLYNQAVYEVLCEQRGQAEALVFARAATAGSQTMPVHWGGDSEPTFVSMAETLRGGLSLAMSGFGYWSHDMGGFEGKPNNDVFTRWFPFGMFSSHSRLHGSNSYRVPMLYGEEATKTAKRFTQLKNRLMPYILLAQNDVVENGTPMMRPMVLEFPDDIGARNIDTQYMFGPKLLIALVMTETGDVDFYLPSTGWTNVLNGNRIAEKGWHHEQHEFDSLPVMVHDATTLPLGSHGDKTVYDYADNPVLVVVQPSHGNGKETITIAGDNTRRFETVYTPDELTITPDDPAQPWRIVVIDDKEVTEMVNATQHEQTWVPEFECGIAVKPTEYADKVVIRFR